MKVVKIGDRLIGEGQPLFIILELGVNFKDLAEAKKLIDAGVATGADAVKFQTFHADTVAMQGAVLQDGRGDVDQHAELLSSEDRLTDDFQAELLRYTRSKGVVTFSTPSHINDVALLNRIGGAQAFKFGSDDLTNLPLLRHTARFGKPILISSGVSTLAQIDEAIRTIRSEGNEQIMLFHCVSQYPADPKDINLNTMVTLQRAFDVPVGLSDHTEGVAVAIAAAALGAKLLEKHFTLDRAVPGPDNFFSMEPGPMKTIIDGIRDVEKALGVPYKEIREAEKPMVVNFHKSIFATQDIEAGAPVTADKISILRPFIGIPAKDLDVVLGMCPRRRVKKGQALQWEDFKAPPHASAEGKATAMSEGK